MWIIALCGSLLLLGVFILWVPLDISVKASVYEKTEFQVRLTWFFGLVNRDITRKDGQPVAEKSAAKKPKKRRFKPRLFFRLLGIRGLKKNLLRLNKAIFSSLRFRDTEVDLRIGLGDPADTGLVFTFLGPAAALLALDKFDRVRLLPAFEDDLSFQGHSTTTVQMRPIRLIPPLLRFMFSPAAVRAAWKLVRNR